MPGPQRLPAVKFTTLMPTEEEIKEAQAILDGLDKKGAKSKMVSMLHFFKTAEDTEGLESRGGKRHELLKNFLVHQLRSKHAAKTCKTGEVRKEVEANGTLWTWMSKETMDQKLGQVKAQHWRDSGKLKDRSDSLTGATDEHPKEYRVPKTWESLQSLDELSLSIDAEENITEDVSDA